jgi:hypothetical protein
MQMARTSIAECSVKIKGRFKFEEIVRNVKRKKNLTATPKFSNSIMLKIHMQIASRNANIETNAIKLAIMHPTGFNMSMAPTEIASKTLLNFLSNKRNKTNLKP